MEVQEDDQQLVTDLSLRSSISSSIDSRTSESVVASTSSSMPLPLTPSSVERGASSKPDSVHFQQRPNGTGGSSAGHPEGDSNGVQSSGSGTARNPSLFHPGKGFNYNYATNQISRAVPCEPSPPRLNRMNGNPSRASDAVKVINPIRRNVDGKIFEIYQCPLCHYDCFYVHEIRKHLITHAIEILRCPSCGFSTENTDEFREHCLNVCGDYFYQVVEGKSNSRTDAQGKIKSYKPFRCSKCSNSSANKSMLQSHLKSHPPVYQYRCRHCNIFFTPCAHKPTGNLS